MGHFILPSGSAWRIHVSSNFFFPPSVCLWQVVHKTFSWHGYFWGSTFAMQNQLRFLIIFLRASLQDLVNHSFEQEQAPMACLRTRSESVVATRWGLKGCSVSKVIRLNVQMVHLIPRLHHITICNSLSRPHQRGKEGLLKLSGELMWGRRMPQRWSWMKAEDYGLHVNDKQKCSTRAQTQSGQ